MAASDPAGSDSPKDNSRTISNLDTTIGIFDVIKDTVEIAPVKVVFGTVATILGLIRVRCFVASMNAQVLTSAN